MREGTGYIGPLRDSDSDEVKAHKVAAYAAITALRKRNVDYIDRYADVIINSPSHGQHHTRPFVQRLIIGMPYMPDPELTAKRNFVAQGAEVTILHSPSFPEGKGTPGIRAAVAALQAKGHKIRFIEITGRPNHEVLELIAQCDFVIDQLYSDMAMVGFATEAAFFGKPAIVGGYYAAHQAVDIADKWIPPTLFCLPEDIEAAIEKLLVDAEFRCILGERAREFVESRWLASRSAERFLALARGDFPEEWLYNPAHCDYIHGMGMSKQNMQRVMRGMLERHGMSAFGLSDKPRMEKLIKQFAGTATLESK
jgi:glycosyltransferase involved in cell wall biosynthesis